MKKIVALLLAIALTSVLSACSGGKDADASKDMTISFAFGDRKGEYIGETDEKGLPHGYGIFKSSRLDGTAWTYAGEWGHGHWIGQGVESWDSGEKYSGAFSDDAENGYGVMQFPSGGVIAGTFSDNEPDGYCIIYLGGDYDGYVFFGKFANGNANGVVYAPNGATTPGSFIDGTVDFDITVFEEPGKSVAPETEPNAADALAETETVPTTEPQQEVTIGMRNALRAAESYLLVMPFSHSGLMEQLIFDQYSEEEAQYAADNCGADWYEQAEKSAKAYLDIMAFSRGSLIDQLVFDGYTRNQATHGADANGL